MKEILVLKNEKIIYKIVVLNLYYSKMRFILEEKTFENEKNTV